MVKYQMIIKNRDATNTVFAGYPANPKAGYRISSRIFGKAGYRISGRILGLTTIYFVNYQINFKKQR
jgi:hypothetical protein